MRNIINKAMHVNPDMRWDSVLDFSNALAKLDACVDWRCEAGVHPVAYEWTLYDDTANRKPHTKRIRMVENQSPEYRIECEKEYDEDGRVENRPSWGAEDNVLRTDALVQISEILANGYDLT